MLEKQRETQSDFISDGNVFRSSLSVQRCAFKRFGEDSLHSSVDFAVISIVKNKHIDSSAINEKLGGKSFWNL